MFSKNENFSYKYYMKEVFKQVPNTNYYVSNLGRVYNSKSNRYSYGTNGVHGYKLVSSRIGYVHQLVAQLFIPNPNNLPQVNHINEDKTDNRAENLEWCTASYNINYGNRNKLVGLKNRVSLKGHKPNKGTTDKHWYYDKELDKRIYY